MRVVLPADVIPQNGQPTLHRFSYCCRSSSIVLKRWCGYHPRASGLDAAKCIQRKTAGSDEKITPSRPPAFFYGGASSDGAVAPANILSGRDGPRAPVNLSL
jgi:hypothetical protein